MDVAVAADAVRGSLATVTVPTSTEGACAAVEGACAAAAEGAGAAALPDITSSPVCLISDKIQPSCVYYLPVAVYTTSYSDCLLLIANVYLYMR